MGTSRIGFVDYAVMCIAKIYFDYVGPSLVFAAAFSGYGIGILLAVWCIRLYQQAGFLVRCFSRDILVLVGFV